MYQSENVDSGIQPCRRNDVQHGRFSVFWNILVFPCLPFSTSCCTRRRWCRQSEDSMTQLTLGCSCSPTELNRLVCCCVSDSAYLSVTQHKGLEFHPGGWSWPCCFLLPYSIPCMILFGCLSLFLGDVRRVVLSFELVWLKLPSPIFPWSNVDVFSSSSGNSVGMGLLNQRVGACLTLPESLSFLKGLCHKVLVREQDGCADCFCQFVSRCWQWWERAPGWDWRWCGFAVSVLER